jgi:hypothetical protein
MQDFIVVSYLTSVRGDDSLASKYSKNLNLQVFPKFICMTHCFVSMSMQKGAFFTTHTVLEN